MKTLPDRFNFAGVTLTFWGSDCDECGNATPGSMRCDDCQSDAGTSPLYLAEGAKRR